MTSLPLPSADSLEITPEAAAACLSAQDEKSSAEVRFIDCREEDEYAFCRIEGAELVPLSRFAEIAPAKFSGADGRPVVVYCHHGMRSLRAAMFLRRLGVEKSWSLAGGIDTWSRIVDSSIPRY